LSLGGLSRALLLKEIPLYVSSSKRAWLMNSLWCRSFFMRWKGK
jgi:hypothetical protein